MECTSPTFRVLVVCSPLMVACEFGHTEVAGILIARGAVVNFQNKVRQSCMMSIITVVLKNSMVIGM